MYNFAREVCGFPTDAPASVAQHGERQRRQQLQTNVAGSHDFVVLRARKKVIASVRFSLQKRDADKDVATKVMRIVATVFEQTRAEFKQRARDSKSNRTRRQVRRRPASSS